MVAEHMQHLLAWHFCGTLGTTASWARRLATCIACMYAFMHPVPCVPYAVGMDCQQHLKKKGIALALILVCRWAEVQHLVDNKSLLFYASDAQTKAGKVVKYVTQYGSEVHQTLSDAGLAPVLYELVQLPGGFMQVSYNPTLVKLLHAC